MKFYDIVDKKYDPELKQRVLTFPGTGLCEDCGGHRYVYHKEFDPVSLSRGKFDDPHLAIQIALVKFGYTGDFKNLALPEPKPCCSLEDDGSEVRSALKLDAKWGVFPTLTVCSGCGGYVSAARGMDEKGKDPKLAWRVALVQFGDSTCKNYDNAPPSHACNCAERVAELDKEIAALPLVKDSGWGKAGGLPHRGITDFARNMKFSRDLETEEMNTLREWLQRKECPGWTGVMVRTYGGGKYGFTTTWDSSD